MQQTCWLVWSCGLQCNVVGLKGPSSVGRTPSCTHQSNIYGAQIAFRLTGAPVVCCVLPCWCAAPEEARAVLQAAMQLMPPERSPAGSKRPASQQQQRAAPNHTPGGSRLQQQQPPPYQQQYHQQPSQQQQPAQHKAPNGVAARPVNGMEPLGRCAASRRQRVCCFCARCRTCRAKLGCASCL